MDGLASDLSQDLSRDLVSSLTAGSDSVANAGAWEIEGAPIQIDGDDVQFTES